jgi:hypothetical protein
MLFIVKQGVISSKQYFLKALRACWPLNNRKKTPPSTVSSGHVIEAYVVYRRDKHEQEKQIVHFCGRVSSDNTKKIKASPIFFDKERGVDYLRHRDPCECLLKVSIPQAAIVGSNDELSITMDRLNFIQVHDLFDRRAAG